MKCKACGYPKNKPEDSTCNLCGAKLDGGGVFEPTGDVFGRDRDLSRAKVETPRQDGATPDQIVYAGDFAIVYAFVPVHGDLIILSPGEVFTFGRGDMADHQIDSKHVSRRHARVHWQGTDPPVPEITDLESKNGITVNGIPVQRRILEDGDEVSVGNTEFTLRVLSANDDLYAQVQCDRLSATMVAYERLSGEIRLVPMPFLLHHLERIKESGTISVMSAGRHGSVTMISGVVISAEFEGMEGENAILGVARLRDGLFSFSPRADAPPQSINRTISELLAKDLNAGGGGSTQRMRRRPPPPGLRRPGGGRRRGPPRRRGGPM
jgi:hypothetical protein